MPVRIAVNSAPNLPSDRPGRQSGTAFGGADLYGSATRVRAPRLMIAENDAASVSKLRVTTLIPATGRKLKGVLIDLPPPSADVSCGTVLVNLAEIDGVVADNGSGSVVGLHGAATVEVGRARVVANGVGLDEHHVRSAGDDVVLPARVAGRSHAEIVNNFRVVRRTQCVVVKHAGSIIVELDEGLAACTWTTRDRVVVNPEWGCGGRTVCLDRRIPAAGPYPDEREPSHARSGRGVRNQRDMRAARFRHSLPVQGDAVSVRDG